MFREKTGSMAVAVVLCWLAPATGRAADPDWIADQDGVLEVRVAKEEKGGLCGAVLRLDGGTRRLVFEGVTADIGCKQVVTVSFDDVDSVGTGDDAGFSLRLKKGKPKKLVLLPVPHARWFADQWKVGLGGMATPMKYGPSELQGPGGKAAPSGDAAGAAASSKRVPLPPEVVADTKMAVECILKALGR